MVEIEINKKKIKVENGIPIIQACKSIGIDIPRFCYHEKLSIAGNCRMCLVEVEKSLKPVAACAMPVMPGMKIFTDTPLVKKAREGVMELLLANHPLDCPICDQGGECDLQDQAMAFGNDRGRFYENKRAVEDKDCGPLIKTVMTRCIHCTRCVRYSSEIAGINDLGTLGRGNSMEIGTYIKNMLISEVSGNVIDLCPVGALTSKPYAFIARSWELKVIETIDLFDSMGTNILVSIRGNDLMRVLPQINESINEEWITDKTRFSYDGFRNQRLTKPMIKKNGNLFIVSWEEALLEIVKNIYKGNYLLEGVIGSKVDLETIVMAQKLFNYYGNSSLVLETERNSINIDNTKNYLFNTKFMNIKKTDFVVLVGTNLRLEMPLLTIKLRREQKNNNITIVSIGATTEYYFKVNKIGNGGKTLVQFLEGRHKSCIGFVKAQNPMVIFGMYSIQENYKNTLIYGFKQLNNFTNLITVNWNGLNNLQINASTIGGFDLGVGIKNVKGKDRVLYLLNTDNVEINLSEYKYIIYQGHHGSKIIEKADVILPSVTTLEKESSFVNNEGKLQLSKFIFTPEGAARVDWQIIRVLLEYLGYFNELPNNIESVRKLVNNKSPYYFNKDKYITCNLLENKMKGYINYNTYNNFYNNFYMTDNITRASKVMAVCTNKVKPYVSNYKWK